MCRKYVRGLQSMCTDGNFWIIIVVVFCYFTLPINVVRCSFGEIIKVDPNFNFLLLNKTMINYVYITHLNLFILSDDNIHTYNSRDIQVIVTMYHNIVVMNKAGGLRNHMDQVSLVKVN